MESSAVNFKFSNWAQTYVCFPQLYFEPTNEAAVKGIVAHARENQKRVRVCGCGHSPSDLACSNEYLLSLKKMNRILEYDEKSGDVLFEAGVTLQQLNEFLQLQGRALSNLGSISNLTFAGGVSVATHGTGLQYGSLCSQVLEISLLTSEGVVRRWKRSEDADFFAVVCSLGVMGVILSLKVCTEPKFQLCAIQYSQDFDVSVRQLEALASSAQHVRLWWFPHTEKTLVWKANRVYGQPIVGGKSWFWDRFVGYHLLEFCYFCGSFFTSLIPAINRLYFRLFFQDETTVVDESHRVFNFDCLFKQFVTEWAIPLSRAPEALLRLKSSLELHSIKAHFPVEIRFVAAEDAWLSPAYQRDSCYIGIIMYRPYGKDVPIQKYWTIFEEIMAESEGRPHWAKTHPFTRKEISRVYPNYQRFLKLLSQIDPHRMFRNSYTDRIFY